MLIIKVLRCHSDLIGRSIAAEPHIDGYSVYYEDKVRVIPFEDAELISELKPDTIAMEMDDLIASIEQWGHDTGILSATDGSNFHAQLTKLIEELGELVVAVRKDNYPAMSDGLGDAMVVLIIMSRLLFPTQTMATHLFKAWLEIKNRKGRMVGGLFVKESDEI